MLEYQNFTFALQILLWFEIKDPVSNLSRTNCFPKSSVIVVPTELTNAMWLASIVVVANLN